MKLRFIYSFIGLIWGLLGSALVMVAVVVPIGTYLILVELEEAALFGGIDPNFLNPIIIGVPLIGMLVGCCLGYVYGVKSEKTGDILGQAFAKAIRRLLWSLVILLALLSLVF